MGTSKQIHAALRVSALTVALTTAMGGANAFGAMHESRDFAYVSNRPGIGWQGTRFVYIANGRSLADTLNLFGADQNVPVSLTGRVSGNVHGRYAMAPQQFLDTMCASFGLVWYFDGTTIQVSPASDQQSLTMRFNYLSPEAMAAALEGSGAADRHFPLRPDPVTATLSVTGPAGYLQRIRDAAQREELAAQSRVRAGTKILRLSSASAADQVRMIDGRQLVVPGAATLLARRFRQTRRDPEGVSVVEFTSPLPVIEADAATNSILIRDTPERIDGDAMLVADFDTLPQVVTLQTWVIDVDRDALAELGVTVPATQAPLAPVALAGPEVPEAPDSADVTVPSPAPATALPVSSATSATSAVSDTPDSLIVADGGNDLFNRLRALEQSRRAHTEVRRTAVTFDRAPAVIDQHEARLVQSVGLPTVGATDLWLAIEPTLGADPTDPRIGLRVDLGPGAPRLDEAGRSQAPAERIVAASVAAGDCLVIVAPSSGGAQMGPANPAATETAGTAADGLPANPANAGARQRLVLLIPRVAI